MKRKTRRKLSNIIIGTIIPFLTVFFIATISLVIYERIRRVSNGNETMIFIVMLSTIFALSLLFIVGDKIQRKITTGNPVKEILEATEKISQGDFSVRLETIKEYEKYNDFDLIKENLNKMASELEKSEILKTDFISNISHELKTPLSIIQNYIFLLQDDKLDKETKEKYIKTVVSATKRLTNLITNVLKLNKLEHQELNVEFKEIKLHDMLAETVINFEDIIEKKDLEIDCQFEEITVFSSDTLLEIVWNNLISNAIKFTDKKGKITIKLQRTLDGVSVEVSDTGCGISKETGKRIFDKFYQGDTSHSNEGNGLGLALVKKVIDIIGGEISVSSEIGKGTTFKVLLKGNE